MIIIESLDVLKAKEQLGLSMIYEQLTLPLDFGRIEQTVERKK